METCQCWVCDGWYPNNQSHDEIACFTSRCKLLANQYGEPFAKPDLAKVRELTNEFCELEGNSSGGSLHIVLDDGNTEGHHVEWCRERARENRDEAGFWLAQLLLMLTDEERVAL